jgi:hypothetical protein
MMRVVRRTKGRNSRKRCGRTPRFTRYSVRLRELSKPIAKIKKTTNAPEATNSGIDMA